MAEEKKAEYKGKKTKVTAIADHVLPDGKSINLWGVAFTSSVEKGEDGEPDVCSMIAEVPEELAKELQKAKRVK